MTYLRFLLPLIGKAECLEDWKDVCKICNPSVFLLKCERTKTICGGFFINPNGYGVSAFHFYVDIGKKTNDCFMNYNGKKYSFDIVAKSEEDHIIIVKGKGVKPEGFLKFAKETPVIGVEAAIFSTNPFGNPIFEPGYVLDLSYTKVQDVKFPCIRSSCRGGPGYSGGALVNRQGLVLGMQKSFSNLFTVFDSIAIPSANIVKFLKKKAKETENGWEF
ncbi:hypothetical protein SteCoe_4571 [Stentor coeruleus]|uniref:Serine protease n=1 Tax=Stentor coeruleus TaxID=5963 RepID=A0A1R2CUI7_9CILI|nr:hypothetical protein SteCoe_4571 [Stentor coeruleus]